MGIAMNMLTTYSIDKKNQHDDVPDCNSMFIKQNTFNDVSNSFEVLGINSRLF